MSRTEILQRLRMLTLAFAFALLIVGLGIFLYHPQPSVTRIRCTRFLDVYANSRGVISASCGTGGDAYRQVVIHESLVPRSRQRPDESDTEGVDVMVITGYPQPAWTR